MDRIRSQDGCGCNRRVRKRGTTLVGVCDCDEDCDEIPLTAADVKVLEFNLDSLGRAVAKAFDCRTKTAEFGLRRTKQIASLGGECLPIILTIQPDQESFTNAVGQLGSRLPKGFILLAPTKEICNGNAIDLLSKAKAGFFDLESNLVLLPSGKLQARKRGGELFSPYLSQASEPTDEDQARLLFALVEKMEDDGRLKNPSVMEVFRLYCIKGKTTDQIKDICRTSKGTVINRLEVIRNVTGKDPKELQAFLYLNFHLPLSVNNGLGRWDCPAACRRQDSGADEFVTFWHWFLTKCAGSLNRPCLCPKLEPLIERPAKVSSHLQE